MFPRRVALALWALAEVAVAACDLAEVIGSAIGLQLLFGVPLLVGVILTMFDTLVLLFLHNKGVRMMEAFIVSLIATVGLGLAIEVILAKPEWHAIVGGFTPSLPGPGALYLAIGILGATIAPIAFAVALIAAGQSSTITGTLAGQIVMEGFLELRLRPLIRRLLTRSIAIAPAVVTLVFFGERATGSLLVLSQVVLSLQLSFAVIPLIHLVSDRRWMGQYVIKIKLQASSWLVAGIIVILNLMLAVETISGWTLTAGRFAWILWLTVIPVSLGLFGLLVYVTVEPIRKRLRNDPTPLAPSIHGPAAMPAVLPPRQLKKVAAAIDFSSADTAVLSHAVSIAKNAGRSGTIILLHVVESVGARLLGSDLEDNEARADQQRLELYVNELRELGVDASYDLGFGNPADALATLISTHKPDLLVVGSHGHRGVGDLVYGTTVERLRHRTKLPLLIVPATISPDPDS